MHCESHVPGYLSKDDKVSDHRKKFEQYVAATEPIEISDWGDFTLSKDYCLKAIETVESFFDQLLPLVSNEVEAISSDIDP